MNTKILALPWTTCFQAKTNVLWDVLNNLNTIKQKSLDYRGFDSDAEQLGT
ncbi:hypothetical protein NBRC116592_11870 [Colwellia sp. KU-HH00111]